MPEYLAPGVYIEEVSYRAKSIEGVSTSVCGFVGPTRYGPVGGEPELITSFADYDRIYGGLDGLEFELGDTTTTNTEAQVNYVAHAVRAFFDNGGSKLYVTRIYEPDSDAQNIPADTGKANVALGSPGGIRARFPGRDGNMLIRFGVGISANKLSADGTGNPRLSGVSEFDLVYIHQLPGSVLASPDVDDGFYDVGGSGSQVNFSNGTAVSPFGLSRLNPVARYSVHLITVTVSVLRPGQFSVEELIGTFSFHPLSRNALTNYFTRDPDSRNRFLHVPFEFHGFPLNNGSSFAAQLFGSSTNNIADAIRRSVAPDSELNAGSPDTPRPRASELEVVYNLTGGSDGRLPTANTLKGSDTGLQKTGLETFADLDEISIVAAPGYSHHADQLSEGDDDRRATQIAQNLISHCERMRYRVCVLDSPDQFVLSEVRNFRGKLDSKYGALYYPWVSVLDPTDRDGRREIELPPSGFVAGIYARTDVERGVFKAPANEVVRGAIGFETLLNKAQQDILNPEGINCFRYFVGRGFRLWGARTISSDPEWKYISVRRYFAYLEHSIDKGTQWAVFENNSDPLWTNIRRTVEDFLFNEWKNGALMGLKPEEAFFVRCDRTTMTQNDLDNGRLICLVGVAVVKPAEFVIFRIGQWTADRKV
jgi:phage tail sheath protein FI